MLIMKILRVLLLFAGICNVCISIGINDKYMYITSIGGDIVLNCFDDRVFDRNSYWEIDKGQTVERYNTSTDVSVYNVHNTLVTTVTEGTNTTLIMKNINKVQGIIVCTNSGRRSNMIKVYVVDILNVLYNGEIINITMRMTSSNYGYYPNFNVTWYLYNTSSDVIVTTLPSTSVYELSNTNRIYKTIVIIPSLINDNFIRVIAYVYNEITASTLIFDEDINDLKRSGNILNKFKVPEKLYDESPVINHNPIYITNENIKLNCNSNNWIIKEVNNTRYINTSNNQLNVSKNNIDQIYCVNITNDLESKKIKIYVKNFTNPNYYNYWYYYLINVTGNITNFKTNNRIIINVKWFLILDENVKYLDSTNNFIDGSHYQYYITKVSVKYYKTYPILYDRSVLKAVAYGSNGYNETVYSLTINL